MKPIVLTLLMSVLPALGDGLPTQPYIYVQGEAQEERKADVVNLSFTLAAIDQDVVKANRAVQAQAQKVFALLKSTGLAEGDTIAAELESEAEYDENPDTGKRGKLLGYRVTRDFSVKVYDLAKFPKLIDDLLALKIAEFDSINENFTKAEEMKDAVIEKALANARSRADKIAKASGMKVDSVWAVSPVAFPDIQPSIFGGSSDRHNVAYAVVQDEKREPSEYRLAPVKVSQTVHVIYLTSPVK